MFPTYEEAYMLATSEFDKLSYEEKTMLKFSKLTEVNKLVKILIFERKFFDEIFLLEELLDKFRYTFEKLINSEEIKILLKMLLDLGNMINSDFLGRTKKLSGFKLSSINLFFDYKGQNDYNLFKYLMECIDDKNMIENLIKDFKYLDFVRKEHLSKIKDKINFFIIQYSENLEIFYSLEYDKETFKNFLVFVSDKLDDIKIKYEECVIQANKIKIMFDENDKKNVIEILDNIGTLISKVINYKNSSNV
ncbi:formin-like protein [Vairimorpha apis BRL 01]|uniref:Formin-like protein n=1 Tax=Vairimorpha apis BRL 01 TaxID=1037528 RepID=T0MIJ0_9MICR|nr:formin-like protein [Vairimorpha apis BRL 01]